MQATHVLTPEQYREMAEREAAGEATKEVVEKHIAEIMEIRERFPLEDLDLLSANIGHRRGVPRSVKRQVSALQEKMAAIIEEVALRIEAPKYQGPEETLAAMRISHNERSRAHSLIGAEKEVHISCQALRIAIDFFSELNKHTFEKIEAARASGEKRRERSLVLGNAILVYELTDFLIKYIKSFELQGIGDIEGLHASIKQEVERLRDQEERRKEDLLSDKIDPSVRDHLLSDIENRMRSFGVLEEEWDSYLGQIDGLKAQVAAIVETLPTLNAIKDNAQGQIEFLQAAAIMNIVKSNLSAVQSSISSLEGLKLVSLSPDRVRLLLGIGD
jgi:hypothetical protein